MNKWKEASSLIITSACKGQCSLTKSIKSLKEHENSNFKVLSLKKMGRSTSKRQKPHVIVFPGGHFSPADSAHEWETLFSSFGLHLSVLSKSLNSGNPSKLPILDNKDRGEDIPRWLSLRITAIRETFEECGILLCKRNQDKGFKTEADSSVSLSSHLNIDDVEDWRTKVLNDPFQFISMCKQCGCYPDVQSLSLWSNWLTPNYIPDRFDAVFFLTCIESSALLQGSPDYKEIASTQWHRPEELLALAERNEIFLKPPQMYELNRLLKIQDFELLQKSVQPKTSAISCERCMPVHVTTSNGVLFLLPGDEMYPEELKLFEQSPIYRENETMESLRCNKMHRLEYSEKGTKLLDTRDDLKKTSSQSLTKSKF